MRGVELRLLQDGVELFQRRLAGVDARQWRWPTPCAGWTVLDLVGHVVTGNEMAAGLLTADPAPASGSTTDLARDPKAAFARSADRQHRAFSGADPDEVVDHPARSVPARRLAIYRSGDIIVHTWDLARAIGVDERPDPALAEHILEPYVDWVATLDTAGVFAEPVAPPRAREPRLNQLLRLLGRRP